PWRWPPARCLLFPRIVKAHRAGERLRIAQVSPLYESVPPRRYGGTERVVSYLTEELMAQGHDVTLFASGDSRTSARLVPVTPRAIRLDNRCRDPLAHHILMIEKVFAQQDRFDLIHFHCDYIHFPLSRRSHTPTLTTLHGRLDLPDLVPLYREYADMPLVSISDAQREPIPRANWRATIHHGIPAGVARLYPNPGRYLAFVGRVSPEKRVDRAIQIAHRVGLPIKIAAKVDAADREYFEDVVRPLLSDPDIDFVGEIAEEDKDAFLGNALALLFPIDWPEPFGLVMIEAMARGTPVIAFAGGSVREVVENGLTGFVVGEISEAVRAVERVSSLDREAVRTEFERRFTADRMARDYAELYARQIEERARRACEPASMT
ncbi:MAG TPA: glycosyltransferase family 4 protein, partial [Candidatus Eisenbacteria bacterium]|nr:glycosyltransferase family 4 protein [Candidatus Eisenbacteria bacterium]